MQTLINLSKKRYRRYLSYLILTLVISSLPFIQIQGNQIFLLSFDHKELHLLGKVFTASELYLMPFLLILLFVGIFFMTTLGGRMWCGWCCPQTIFRVIFRDLIETKILGLRKSIADKQKKPNYNQINILKKILAIAIFSVIALTASAIFLFYFVPPHDFFHYMSSPQDHKILIGFWLCISIFMIFDITFMAENFCIYMCPYARVQSVLFENNTLMAIYDSSRGGEVYDSDGNLLPPPQKQNPSNECINCRQCVKVCPTHIDIRKGMQLECIHCLECVDACSDVMGKLGKATLVNWSSPNALATHSKVKYFRGVTFAYLAVIAIILIATFIMGSKKEAILVNIDRNTELYSIRKNHAVDNFYVFLFENTDKQEHSYSFRILNEDQIKILRPKAPILVKPGEKVKEVVILRTHQRASNNAIKNIPIEIEIYATDKPSLRVQKQTAFTLP